MRNSFKIFFTFFFIYSYFIMWGTWNEESRFSLVKAIVEEKKFEIDSFYNFTGDRLFHNNHYYSDKLPGPSFLSTFQLFMVEKLLGPIEIINVTQYYVLTMQGKKPFLFPHYNFSGEFSRVFLTIFSSSIFSALTVTLFYKFTKFLLKEEKLRIIFSLMFGLGTLVFPVGLVYWSHSLVTFLTFLSFYLLFTKKSWKFIFLSGIFLGYSLISNAFSLLFLPFYLLYSFLQKRWKGAFLFFIGVIFSFIPEIFYNYLLFNEIFPIAVRKFNDPAIWFVSPNEPRYDLTISFFNVTLFQYSLTQKNLEYLPYTALKLLFYPERGLFFYSPILFLFPFGFPSFYKKYKKEALLVLLLFLTFWLCLSGRYFWYSGICFGSRDFALLIPFLMILVVYSHFKLQAKLIYFLFFFSFLFNLLGLQAPECLSLFSSPTDISISSFIPDIKKFNLFFKGEINEIEQPFVLKNPLFEYYLPLFLKNGPRSRIFESLIFSIMKGDAIIDITYMCHLPISPDRYIKNQLKFTCFIPLFLIICMIWKNYFYHMRTGCSALFKTKLKER